MVSAVVFALLATLSPFGGTPASSDASVAPINGIACDKEEHLAFHVHAHLTIMDHGKVVPIYMFIGQRPIQGCIYWVHTHSEDGIIHIEAPIHRHFYLGEFFAIWGQPLSLTRAASAKADPGTRLRIWVNGVEHHGDPREIELMEHTDIFIEAGPPWLPPVRYTDWRTY